MADQSRKIHGEKIITARAKMCVFHGWRAVMYTEHMHAVTQYIYHP